VSGAPLRADLPPELARRIAALCDDGREIWQRFDADVRRRGFHPFVASDYEVALDALLPLRAPGRRFLEWGSATGVVTIMADLLGFEEAAGIEIDPALVDVARELARRYDSRARFVAGSFVPDDYTWRSSCGDERLGTIEHGAAGYGELGRDLADFHVVYGYPWGGEEPMMRDLMRRRGGTDALLLLHG
jgi:hypothetical protein